MTKTFSHAGLIVYPIESESGEVFYAEIEPAGSRWLPWPGRTSRWWYEIHSVGEPDEHGTTGNTYAYTPGGSGGAFTLRACIIKASEAVEKIMEEK